MLGGISSSEGSNVYEGFEMFVHAWFALVDKFINLWSYIITSGNFNAKKVLFHNIAAAESPFYLFHVVEQYPGHCTDKCKKV